MILCNLVNISGLFFSDMGELDGMSYAAQKDMSLLVYFHRVHKPVCIVKRAWYTCDICLAC